jgi:hypothetical protein
VNVEPIGGVNSFRQRFGMLEQDGVKRLILIVKQ